MSGLPAPATRIGIAIELLGRHQVIVTAAEIAFRSGLPHDAVVAILEKFPNTVAAEAPSLVLEISPTVVHVLGRVASRQEAAL